MSAAHVPPIFVSHTPSLALEHERSPELAQWGRDLPRPRAILAISSDWQAAQATRGTTATHRATYPAPGAPDLAYELHSLLPVERAGDHRLDDGAMVPLVHLFPDADVPVLQLSLVVGATSRSLFAIGRKIGLLASRGVLLIGSGGVTWPEERNQSPDAPPADWARAFDAWVANVLADAEMEDLLLWRTKGPNARLAHSTPAHLDPLFLIAGAASLYDHAVGFPIRGFEHGTVSRRCVQFGR